MTAGILHDAVSLAIKVVIEKDHVASWKNTRSTRRKTQRIKVCINMIRLVSNERLLQKMWKEMDQNVNKGYS